VAEGVPEFAKTSGGEIQKCVNYCLTEAKRESGSADSSFLCLTLQAETSFTLF
jgi:hypothetical protein